MTEGFTPPDPAESRPRPSPATEDVPPGASLAAVLLGLTGFAIAQPLLSLAGSNPALFVFNRVSRAEMVLLAVAILLVPPVEAWVALVFARRIAPRGALWLYRAVVVALAFLAGVWIGRDLGLGTWSVVFGALLALAGLAAVARSRTARDWLRYTAVLPLVALASFLVTSESAELLREEDDARRNEIAGEEPSILLLVLDELPTMSLLDDSGTIDADRFPNFARLASESTWYRNFSAMTRTTETAVPTLLTGQLPRLDKPLWTNYPDNLFPLLAPTHGLTVHEPFTKLCGVNTCGTAGPNQSEQSRSSDLGAAASELVDLWVTRIRGEERTTEDFTDFAEQAEEPVIDFEGPGFFPSDDYVQQWPTRFIDFAGAVVPGDDPWLYYLHLLLPHYPWQWYPDGTLYSDAPDVLAYWTLTGDTPWINAVNEHRHLLQVQYVDELIGELLTTLEDRGLYEETAIVLVADHGTSFRDDQTTRDMSEAGRSGTAFVPLIVKHPGQTSGVIDDTNLMAIDFIPILARVAGVDIPWEVDGAAPDDPSIALRGDEKTYYGVEWVAAPTELEGPLTFDGVTEFPLASERFIRPSRLGDNDIAPLLDLLDSRELIGAPIPDVDRTQIVNARVYGLDELRSGDRPTVQAFVQGVITDETAAAEVLVVVDGAVITGSPVYPAGDEPGFVAMLPREVAGQPLDLELYVVDEQGDIHPVEFE